MRAHPRQDGGADAEHGVGAVGTRGGSNPLECLVTCLVEHIGIIGNFTARQLLERAHETAAHTHRIGDIAEDVLDRRKARVHMAVQFLRVAGRGEEGAAAGFREDAGTDKQKFRISGKAAQLTGYAGHTRSAVLLRFLGHARKGVHAAVLNRLRDLGDFAAKNVVEAGPERAQKAHRIDAVADDQFAGAIAL